MKSKLDPASLSIDDVVKILSASGAKQISAERINADIELGAPVNPSGTINLVHYAAWLVKEMGRGRD